MSWNCSGSIATVRLLGLCLLLALAACSGSDGQGAGTEMEWLPSWATSIQGLEDKPDHQPPIALAGNTLRQFLWPTFSGEKVRIQLSNAKGEAPLEIAKVHLARAATGSDPGNSNGQIDAASDVAFTFDGVAGVTIPPGQTAWSDPVDFPLRKIELTAISIQFGNRVPEELSTHPGSRTTSYFAEGDRVSQPALPDAQTRDRWYLLNALEVMAPPEAFAIAVLGDSITDGYGVLNAFQRWPDYLTRAINADPELAGRVSVLNFGMGANNLTLSSPDQDSGLVRFERDVLSREKIRYLLVLEGVNDIKFSGVQAKPIIDTYRHIVERAHEAGITVYGSPITPMSEDNAVRNAVNASIRGDGYFDAVIDLDAAVRDPAAPNHFLHKYDKDGLHPNVAGYEAMGNAVDLALFTGEPLAQQPGQQGEDGYELWLRYRPVQDEALLGQYREAFGCIVVEDRSSTLGVAAQELQAGLGGLLEQAVAINPDPGCAKPVLIGTIQSSPGVLKPSLQSELKGLGEGYFVRHADQGTVIAAESDTGALYGVFAFLRHLQTRGSLDALDLVSKPAIGRRLLNHWDNLDRSVERGYAGQSLWEWEKLPAEVSPRYRDYARANASIGINGTVLTNVNADARVLTPEYLEKVAAIADVFRPYRIRVYLTARFSAPIEIGGLHTADPADAGVQRWWAAKTDEIYRYIPDFGGFLVKANSEGQPGPQDYGRSHADGANMLADAVAPHGGIVMWRTFVYSNEEPADRIRQAFDEFMPLDGQFRDNVVIQTKNGPLDFQPREPIHPLLGAMTHSPVALELQITKEYLGQDTHLVYLGPLFAEVLATDTFAAGPGSTVARVTDGSLHGHDLSVIAGVANIGDDRNWSGSHFNQANWYAYGRLAWDPGLDAGAIAEEWIRGTFSNEPDAVQTIAGIMEPSHQAVVDYMTPLGLVHIMAEGHHYGPGPWVADLPRADWTSVYYHRADVQGIGFDRTATGSNALEQYFEPLRDAYASREAVPLAFLLFFHRVAWQERLEPGNTLWQEMVARYDQGVAAVQGMGASWRKLEDRIDPRRFAEVSEYLEIQLYEARWWRDAVLAYFQSINGLEIPEGHEEPAHDLEFYESLDCPKDRDRPRCPEIYGVPEARAKID